MSVLVIIIFAIIIYFVFAKDSPTFLFFRKPSNIGKAGEGKVSHILCSLPPEYLVINNVTIPDQKFDITKNFTTQIDHVIVSPYGIFVIETKNYSGWIFGSEKNKRWKQTFKTTEAHYFYNPIKQNWGHTYALAEHLQLNIRVFKPIVVFSNNCELHIDSTTPVVYMSQLKGLILSYTQEIIPRTETASIFERLSKINLVGDEIETKHIQSIGQRYDDKMFSLQQGKCPRCGGMLVFRNGKYGAFYGCSNYPKCNFTQNIRY